MRTRTRSSGAACSGARSASTRSTRVSLPAPPVRVGAGNRARAEEPDPFRLCFERDLDRIKHSRPWRRLAGKCQVFVAPEDDHLRTRLTHAVEVAQVATGIARAVGLNVAAHRGDRARARLRSRAGRPRVGGGVLAVRARRLRPRGVRRRRHARAAQSLRRDARRRPQPLVAPARRRPRPRARSSRGPTASRTSATTSPTRCAPAFSRPTTCPTRSPTSSGRSQSRQIGAFVLARVRRDRPHRSRRDDRAGGGRARARSGRSTSTGSTCGRPPRQQAEKVVGLLRGLVDFFVDAPTRMPVDATDMHAGLVPGLAGDRRGRGALRQRHDRSVRARARCRVARLALRAPAAGRMNRRAAARAAP